MFIFFPGASIHFRHKQTHIQTQALKDIKLRKLVKQNVCNVGIRPKIYENLLIVKLKFEPPHQKTNNLHKRKQRRRSAQVFSAFLFSIHG